MKDAKAELFKNRRSQQIEKLDIRNANYKKNEKTDVITPKKEQVCKKAGKTLKKNRKSAQ